MMVLMLGYVQLTKTGAEISRLKNQLNDLNGEHVQLVTTYERTFDLTTIKEVAEAAGMAKPTAGQIEYIDLSGDDSAVVYRTEAGDAIHELYATAQASLSGLWEYFR